MLEELDKMSRSQDYEERAEDGIALILRGLGSDLPDEQDFGDDYDAGGQWMLSALTCALVDGLDVIGEIARVLVATDDRCETLGALEAIAWYAANGGFPIASTQLARVRELTTDPDDVIRGAAVNALALLVPGEKP